MSIYEGLVARKEKLALVGLGLPLITAEHIVIRLDDDTSYDIQKAAEKAMDAISSKGISSSIYTERQEMEPREYI